MKLNFIRTSVVLTSFILTILAVALPINAVADMLYVANNQNTLHYFNTTTSTDLGLFATSNFQLQRGIAFDKFGNLYVTGNSNSGVATIEEYSPAGVDLGAFATASNAFGGIAFDSLGNLYAVIAGTNVIEKYSSTGADLGVFASANLTGPQQIAFDSSGNLYVTNISGAHTGNILQYNPQGAFMQTFASYNGGVTKEYPVGIAFDKQGNVITTVVQSSGSNLDDFINKFSASGTSLGTLATFHGSDIPSIALDSIGNLYVTNTGGNVVEKYRADGTDLGALNMAGLGMPTFVAFDVPEPSTVVMLIGVTVVACARWQWWSASRSVESA